MSMVKVYQFRQYNIMSDEVKTRGYATREFIERNPVLFIIEDSVMEVSSTQVTPEGRYFEPGRES